MKNVATQGVPCRAGAGSHTTSHNPHSEQFGASTTTFKTNVFIGTSSPYCAPFTKILYLITVSNQKVPQVIFDKLIKLGETEKVEFKSSFNQDVCEAVCAFANKRGGTIFIGLKSPEKILGLQLGDESLQQWLNEIKSKTPVGITF